MIKFLLKNKGLTILGEDSRKLSRSMIISAAQTSTYSAGYAMNAIDDWVGCMVTEPIGS